MTEVRCHVEQYRFGRQWSGSCSAARRHATASAGSGPHRWGSRRRPVRRRRPAQRPGDRSRPPDSAGAGGGARRRSRPGGSSRPAGSPGGAARRSRRTHSPNRASWTRCTAPGPGRWTATVRPNGPSAALRDRLQQQQGAGARLDHAAATGAGVTTPARCRNRRGRAARSGTARGIGETSSFAKTENAVRGGVRRDGTPGRQVGEAVDGPRSREMSRHGSLDLPNDGARHERMSRQHQRDPRAVASQAFTAQARGVGLVLRQRSMRSTAWRGPVARTVPDRGVP